MVHSWLALAEMEYGLISLKESRRPLARNLTSTLGRHAMPWHLPHAPLGAAVVVSYYFFFNLNRSSGQLIKLFV